MKNITLLILISLTLFTFHSSAQFPNFTKVDTGAISQLWGGHGSSTCFDMDNDGDLDLFVGNSAVYANRVFSIFKNEGNGFFIEMPAFITEFDYKMVSSFGDVDNDGDIDLFAGLPNTQLRCYANDGFGNFQHTTSLYSNSSFYYPLLIDLDSDGFLDVIGIDRWGSVNYNNGHGGFQGSTNLGLFHVENVLLHGVSWGDVDNDGDFDFYGGYSENGGGTPKNNCYLNDGNGAFVEFDPTSPIVQDTCTTTCANWVDYDNDGDMDIYVHNVICDCSLPALYENLGDMQFIRHVFVDEMYRYSFANSAVWGDLDNDADLDLYISIENNEFPWGGGTSATPYNVLYLNDGNGQFTNFLEDHSLVTEDSHTALLFDHDNDGDLDVLLTRYSWANDGYNNLFVNEGNDNSWIVLTCEGTISNRSAIGTRVQAKGFVNGKHITQTREITPINGHLSYANQRVHFGLGDADVIDTLILRWPSGHIDTFLNVPANQFYNAIEDSVLEIDFKATNYIQYNPGIADVIFTEEGESATFDLTEHYQFIKGDTVPEITGDTLTFSFSNENPEVATVALNGSIFTIVGGSVSDDSKVQIIASAGFTKRMDQFIVNQTVGYATTASSKQSLRIHPNPCSGTTCLRYQINDKGYLISDLYSISGQKIKRLLNEEQLPGEYDMEVDLSDVPPGVYVVRMRVEEHVETRKMVVF